MALNSSTGSGLGRFVCRATVAGAAGRGFDSIAPAGSKHMKAAAGGNDDPMNNSSKKQQWWRPDPVTGVWIPEDHEGQIDTVQLREERLRSVPTASLEDRAWWTSLEDLPDRSDTIATPSPPESK